MSKWGGRRVTRLRAIVIATYGRTCHLCHRPILGTVSIDHVVPRSKGGSDAIENLRPACLRCNTRRSNRDVPQPLQTSTRW